MEKVLKQLQEQMAAGFEKAATVMKQTTEELAGMIEALRTDVTANTDEITKLGERVATLEDGEEPAEEEEGTEPEEEKDEKGNVIPITKGTKKAAPTIYAPTPYAPGEEAALERRYRHKGIAHRLAHTVTKGAFGKFLIETARKGAFGGVSKVLSGVTDAAGGHLVPTEHRAVLLEIIEEFGWIRRQATNIPMASDTMNVPKSLTEATGSWVAESAQAPEGDPSFSQKVLSAKEARSRVVVPNPLLADSSPKIDAILLDQFARAYAKLEDEAGFNGPLSQTDANPHTGILNDAGTTLVVSIGSVLSYDDLVELEEALTGGARRGAGLYVSRKGFSQIRKLKDANGNPLWTDNIQDGTLGSVLGYPVAVVEAGIPDNVGGGSDETRFILGNIAHVMFGDRESFAVRMSEHVRFEENQTVFMGTERVAITVGNPEGFSVLTGILA